MQRKKASLQRRHSVAYWQLYHTWYHVYIFKEEFDNVNGRSQGIKPMICNDMFKKINRIVILKSKVISNCVFRETWHHCIRWFPSRSVDVLFDRITSGSMTHTESKNMCTMSVCSDWTERWLCTFDSNSPEYLCFTSLPPGLPLGSPTEAFGFLFLGLSCGMSTSITDHIL